ncbi:MAG: hypothetical protein ABH859_01315 [Pseudomonadota bacterium]
MKLKHLFFALIILVVGCQQKVGSDLAQITDYEQAQEQLQEQDQQQGETPETEVIIPEEPGDEEEGIVGRTESSENGEEGDDSSDANDTGFAGDEETPDAMPSSRLQPADLEYLGAFRVPGPEDRDWGWVAHGMTYYPKGDPIGTNDGYPGSLYSFGHAQQVYVTEINIPRPVISPTKNINDLPVATTLQRFRDVGISRYPDLIYDVVHVGMSYLPAQGRQTTDKLYLCYGFHSASQPQYSHLASELNLTNPNLSGSWQIGDVDPYSTTDYMFDIPGSWADTYVNGRKLATGRFRDGGQGGQGPTIIAVAPWKDAADGNLPPANTKLNATTLLLYSSTYSEDPTDYKMNNYSAADDWQGAAWITAGDKAAVIFAGTKGLGNYWYGTSRRPCPEACGPEQGFWADRFQGQIIFYDPADLAKVAQGAMHAYEPQPYAALPVDNYLFRSFGVQEKEHVGAIAFDRERGYLYLVEPRAELESKPIIHVWKITS